MKHIISVKQFLDKNLLESLCASAQEFSTMPLADYPKPLEHLTVATLFYEPSTRTRLSFETAIQNLGAHLISTESAAQFSSAAKGETIEDTTRTINGFADGIVMRHTEIGAAERAAAVSKVPIINAGDGAGEHPTQALLDLYTIKKAFGKIDGLKIALVGDLLNGRTIHSLVQLLSIYNVELCLISPKILKIPKEYIDLFKKSDIKFSEHEKWDDLIDKVDVLYMTRVQKERFKLIEEYIKIKDSFILTKKLVGEMKKEAVIMHPLPRVNEIETAVDSDPRAIYFQQVNNGLYMRMALLNYIYSD